MTNLFDEKLDEITDSAEAMQYEMGKFIEGLQSRIPTASYQDCVNIYFLLRLGEIKQEILELKKLIP